MTLRCLWCGRVLATHWILLSTIDLLNGNWNQWRATEPVELMRPTRGWEGASKPILPSMRGEIGESAHELRDPFIFADTDGKLFLVYAGGGEQALGIVELGRQ